jgi:hypothetical protein
MDVLRLFDERESQERRWKLHNLRTSPTPDKCQLLPASPQARQQRETAETTAETMEFRIFFPLLSDADSDWLTPEEVDAYTKALESMAMNTDAQVESRVDSYFVTNHLYGLKFRHGKKLELKIQGKKVHGVFEVWRKTKLGKKNAPHYKAEIHTAIAAHHPDFSKDDPSLVFEHQIAVGKERARATIKAVFGDATMKYELTKITVSEEQPQFPRSVQIRNWLSIVVEGDSGELTRPFLKSEQNPLKLPSVLRTLQTLWGHRLPEVASRGFLPVVSGYPMFLHVLSGNISEEEQAQLLIPAWQAAVEEIC